MPALALQFDPGNAARERKLVEHPSLMEPVDSGDADQAFAAMRGHIETSLGAQGAWRQKEAGSDRQPLVTGPGLGTVG